MAVVGRQNMCGVPVLLIPLRVFESCLSHVTASIEHPNSILDRGNMLRSLDLAQKILFVYSLQKNPAMRNRRLVSLAG